MVAKMHSFWILYLKIGLQEKGATDWNENWEFHSEQVDYLEYVVHLLKTTISMPSKGYVLIVKVRCSVFSSAILFFFFFLIGLALLMWKFLCVFIWVWLIHYSLKVFNTEIILWHKSKLASFFQMCLLYQSHQMTEFLFVLFGVLFNLSYITSLPA